MPPRPHAPHHPPPPSRASAGPGLIGWAFRFFVVACCFTVPICLALMFTKTGRTALTEVLHGRPTTAGTRVETREVVRTVIEREPPPPLPSNFVPKKDTDITKLFNDIQIATEVQLTEGTFASLERLDPAAYQVRFQVDLRVPKANQTLDELARINPELPRLLPGLATMLPTARVSGFYHKLYENKTKSISRDVTRLNKLLDRHNFFDCETILEMEHPATKKKALLIQSEMDVVCDGSDGDRMDSLDDYISMSDYYQPSTSYFWKKKTATPNPLLARWQKRLNDAKAEYSVRGLSAERNRELKSRIDTLTAEIADLKNHSSLIAEADPFIVLSLVFLGYEKQNGWTPRMGDYAVVIHNNQVLPAICGDYGPTMKMGEASLFMAKQVSAKATPYNRPESDLKVTYLIFPNTALKPNAPPNLAAWRSACAAHLNEIGGLGSQAYLHEWTDIITWKKNFVGPPWPAPKRR